jgi:hypothetical protein
MRGRDADEEGEKEKEKERRRRRDERDDNVKPGMMGGDQTRHPAHGPEV